MRFPLHYIILILILAFYLVVVSLTVFAEQPSTDEAQLADPAVNLLEKGHMGISIKEVAGTQWTRMDQHTYWEPPLHYLAQAGWYWIFGFSLFSMRFLSVFWGAVALLSVYFLVDALTRNRSAALLAMGLTAVDFWFINSAADGRMDMMSAALAFAGFAAYLCLRRKNLSAAMLAGHTLVAASGLTHPNEIMALVGIIVLNLFYDRDRIRIKHVLIALIPYFLGAVGWGLYIMQDPQAFIDQFGGHVSNNLASFSIVKSFQSEIAERYLIAYGFSEHTSSMAKLKLVILMSYLAGVVGSIIISTGRNRQGARALVILFALYFLGMSILIGAKIPRYLIYIMPFYTTLLAIWISSWWQQVRIGRYAIVLFILLVCTLQIGVNARRILKNSYDGTFVPVVEKLNELDDGSKVVMGAAEVAYAVGFRPGFIDDSSLGYFSGTRPDIVVITPWYLEWFERFERHRPEIYEHVVELLENDFEAVFENEKFTIYVLKESGVDG